MLKIKGLHKSYGRNKVLKGIDLTLEGNGITAVLGPNGSGKTTLIKSILGLVIPDSGDIVLDDKNIAGKYLYRNEISHLPQIARFPDNLTPRELMSMIKDLRSKGTRADEIIELFDLEPELDKKMANLSGGNRQKVNLLLALMYDSPFIILDEPSNGLDPVSLLRLKDFLKREESRGKKIIITTHIMGFVEELAQDIVFILDGKIHFHGKMSELLAQEGQDRLEKAIASMLIEDRV